jgi:hypothetical protein
MKVFKTGVFVFCTLICLTFCASKERLQATFPQEIESVYYQGWVGGRPETGSGINLYINFVKPLSKEIRLVKVYFQQKEDALFQLDDRHYVARFMNPNYNNVIILETDDHKEYSNKPTEISKPKFDLKPNEAVLEYSYKNKIRFYKIRNLKEKELIAYP